MNSELKSSDKEKKVIVNFRVTPTEKKKLFERAAEAKMSLGRYIVALSDNRRIADTSSLPPMLIEIRRIGVNINQIATVANTQKAVNGKMLKIVNDDQKELIRILKQVLIEVFNADEHTFKSLEHKIDILVKKTERLERQNGSS